MTLPALAFTRDGWTFVGWATEPDGPVVYADCEAFEGGIDAANGATVIARFRLAFLAFGPYEKCSTGARQYRGLANAGA